jgi:hypothetical protein
VRRHVSGSERPIPEAERIELELKGKSAPVPGFRLRVTDWTSVR